MDKRIAGLLGAAAALTTLSSAQAAVPAQPIPPSSYADLLTPISNATEALKADDARLAEMPADATQVAQYYHHHHHHNYYRRYYYHHHHHHHHHHYYYHR